MTIKSPNMKGMKIKETMIWVILSIRMNCFHEINRNLREIHQNQNFLEKSNSWDFLKRSLKARRRSRGRNLTREQQQMDGASEKRFHGYSRYCYHNTLRGHTVSVPTFHDRSTSMRVRFDTGLQKKPGGVFDRFLRDSRLK